MAVADLSQSNRFSFTVSGHRQWSADADNLRDAGRTARLGDSIPGEIKHEYLQA